MRSPEPPERYTHGNGTRRRRNQIVAFDLRDVDDEEIKMRLSKEQSRVR